VYSLPVQALTQWYSAFTASVVPQALKAKFSASVAPRPALTQSHPCNAPDSLPIDVTAPHLAIADPDFVEEFDSDDEEDIKAKSNARAAALAQSQAQAAARSVEPSLGGATPSGTGMGFASPGTGMHDMFEEWDEESGAYGGDGDDNDVGINMNMDDDEMAMGMGMDMGMEEDPATDIVNMAMPPYPQ
jgi:hypothetical protein